MASQSARYPSLVDRVAIVTGGASGIGAAIVEELHAQGARVCLFDIDSPAAAELVMRLGGERLRFAHVDLTDCEALAAAIAGCVETWGPVRVLVNNAARDDRHDFATLTPARWDAIQAVNLRHHLFASQAVAPSMATAGGGSIICLSSTSWNKKVGGMPGYLAAKAGIVGLVRALARELGPQRIRVNAISPGWVMTERQRTQWVKPGDEDILRETQCIPELLVPADIARVIAFLAADDSRMVTAQNWLVDAGDV